MNLRWELAPYSEPWPQGQKRNTTSRFRSEWSQTLRVLADEVDHLDGGLVIIEVDTSLANLTRDRQQFRPNGSPRTPGVRVCFDSRHGLQRYATGAFTTWRHNVHAVALSLQALRQVDRYGVSRGEQYVGFRPALEAGSKPEFDSAKAAIRWMISAAQEAALEVGGSPDQIYRRLALAWHPDQARDDYDAGKWAHLEAAKLVLEAAGVL